MTSQITADNQTIEHDHNQCIRKAISTAEDLCVSRGVQLTPIRHKILELIWNSHKAVKAYDLLDLIRPINDAAKPGLIHRVESLNAFVGCRNSGTLHDQLLLICTICHNVEERSAHDVFLALANEMQDASFRAQRKTIEIHGLCKGCQAE